MKYFTSHYLTSLNLPSIVRALWERYRRQGLLLRKYRTLRDVFIDIWEFKQPIRCNDGTPKRTLSGAGFHVWLSGMSVAIFPREPLFSSLSLLKRLSIRCTCAAPRLVKIFRPANSMFLWVVHSSDPTWLPRFTSQWVRPGNLEPCFHFCGKIVRLFLFSHSHFLCLSVYNHVFLSSVSLFLWIFPSGKLSFHVMVIFSHFHTLNLKLTSD